MKAWLKGGLIGAISGVLLYGLRILTIFMDRAFGTKSILYTPFYFGFNRFLTILFGDISTYLFAIILMIGFPMNIFLWIVGLKGLFIGYYGGYYNLWYFILFTIYCFFVGVLINKIKKKKIALINGGLIGAGIGLLIGFLILVLLSILSVPAYNYPYVLYILGWSVFFWGILFITAPFLIYFAASASLLITMMLIFTIIGAVFNEIKSKKESQRHSFLKEFFRPTRGKKILTLFLIIISIPFVIIYTFGPNRIYFLPFDLGMIVMKYITACLILYIYTKIKSKK